MDEPVGLLLRPADEPFVVVTRPEEFGWPVAHSANGEGRSMSL